jgi:hypothetical protein
MFGFLQLRPAACKDFNPSASPNPCTQKSDRQEDWPRQGICWTKKTRTPSKQLLFLAEVSHAPSIIVGNRIVANCEDFEFVSPEKRGQVHCRVNENVPRDLIAMPAATKEKTIQTVVIRRADKKQSSRSQNSPDFC